MAENPRHVIVECSDCNSRVSAEVVGRVQVADEGSFYYITELAKCPECHGPIVACHSVDHWGGPDDYDRSSPVRVWPKPVRQLAPEVPQSARDAFDEAQRCMGVQAHTAAAFLARRVLEGIAVDQGARRGTLAAKLKRLKIDGVIDGRLADWAEGLRVVGNDAAHDVDKPVSRDDAADVLTFAEALADYIYTFRVRYDRFVTRRATGSSGT